MSLQQEQKIDQYVCFSLADEEYAVSIQSVQEVLKIKHITPMPQVPDFVLGVMNLRGNIVPVFDLRIKFLLPIKSVDHLSRIIVARVDNCVIGFIADKTLENVRFTSDQIDPSPTVKMNIKSHCIKGIGKLLGRMIVILDLVKIHEEIKKEILEYSVGLK